MDKTQISLWHPVVSLKLGKNFGNVVIFPIILNKRNKGKALSLLQKLEAQIEINYRHLRQVNMVVKIGNLKEIKFEFFDG